MKIFTEHPASVEETYTQHLTSALSFSAKMFIGALCCALHALLPFIFEKAGSDIITDLHHRMVKNRTRNLTSK